MVQRQKSRRTTAEIGLRYAHNGCWICGKYVADGWTKCIEHRIPTKIAQENEEPKAL